MKKEMSMTAVGWLYAFVHFSLEIACFYMLFSRFSASPLWWGLALLYDALAFLPQSMWGAILDRFPKLPMGIVGGILTFSALLIPWPLPALLIISLGNAMVHISGAQATLCGANGKLAPSGIFVGGGSWGVIAGQMLALSGWAHALWIPLVCMAFSLVLMGWIRNSRRLDEPAAGFHVAADLPTAPLVLLTFLVVTARAYVGYAIPTAWNKAAWQAVLLFVCMGIGKAAGGIAADRFGARPTAMYSLLVALPFLLWGDSVMVISLVGVALFNMTMPLALAILVSRFPDNPGLSFGITTIGLFVGSVPAFFIRPQGAVAQILVFVLTLIAWLALMMCLKKGEAYNGRKSHFNGCDR